MHRWCELDRTGETPDSVKRETTKDPMKELFLWWSHLSCLRAFRGTAIHRRKPYQPTAHRHHHRKIYPHTEDYQQVPLVFKSTASTLEREAWSPADVLHVRYIATPDSIVFIGNHRTLLVSSLHERIRCCRLSRCSGEFDA